MPTPVYAGAERHNKAPLSACFSRTDRLLLFGASLWDPRAPKLVHQLDELAEGAAGCFHPNDQEIILNSEVWDMR